MNGNVTSARLLSFLFLFFSFLSYGAYRGALFNYDLLHPPHDVDRFVETAGKRS